MVSDGCEVYQDDHLVMSCVIAGGTPKTSMIMYVNCNWKLKNDFKNIIKLSVFSIFTINLI